MKHFVDLRLFPKATREGFPKTGVVGIVTTFREDRDLDVNMAMLHRLLYDTPIFPREIIYGGDWAFMLYNTSPSALSQLAGVLANTAIQHGQGGYVIAANDHAYFRDVKTFKSEQLLPFDGTTECLESYASRIRPNFVIEGTFPRQHLYVTGELRKLGL